MGMRVKAKWKGILKPTEELMITQVDKGSL